MKRFSLILSLLSILNFAFSFDNKISQQEYISLWKDVAIQQMHNYKIPASITLAQAILESANGNSELANKANNHFGIKCSDWKGDSYLKDDNKKNECFRKYKHAKESFEDHSLFLKNRSRYSFLFTYEQNDFKSWAKGLKQAGYATNPNYPKLLIDLIEKYNLQQFDGKSTNTSFSTNSISGNKTNKIILNSSEKHKVQKHSNDINYVLAKKGDTFYRLSKELNISLKQLYKYNEFGDKKDCLEEGEIVYIEAKKRKSSTKNAITLKEETTLRLVSQTEGIKLKKLLKYNQIELADAKLKKGTKVYLK